MGEDRRELVRQAFEAYNSGDIEAYADFYTDPVVVIDPNSGERTDVHRQDGIVQDRTFLEVFPDHECIIQSMVVDGDRVHVRYINRATHTGRNEQTVAFFGEPTGREVTWGGWSEYRFADGKIVEVAAMAAMRHLLQQLRAP